MAPRSQGGRWLSVLRVSLFGSVRIARDGQASEIRATRTTQALLAYLVLQRHRRHPREALAELLWDDLPPDQARGCLNTALWRLRGMLEPDGIARGTYIETMPSGEVGFNPSSDYWLDVEAFERQVQRAMAHPLPHADVEEIRSLETVLQLYTGDLLESFYDNWVTLERERLHRLFVEALIHLMLWHRSRGSFENSITFGHKALQQDPLREELHRELMLMYLDSGHRAMAIRQYQVCRGLLAAELGVAPMEKTRALYTRIAPGRDPEAASHGPAGPALALVEVLRMLQEISGELDEIGRRLRRVTRMAEHARGGPDPDAATVEPRPRQRAAGSERARRPGSPEGPAGRPAARRRAGW
jgi:DNA-binding SARP family transcriptional activator